MYIDRRYLPKFHVKNVYRTTTDIYFLYDSPPMPSQLPLQYDQYPPSPNLPPACKTLKMIKALPYAKSTLPENGWTIGSIDGKVLQKWNKNCLFLLLFKKTSEKSWLFLNFCYSDFCYVQFLLTTCHSFF